MARYRIHRMKNTPRESFRWGAHTGGLSIPKPKDYEGGEDLEAISAYAAWKALRNEGRPLLPGDIIESIAPDGVSTGLQILKYIGFEPAQWYVPELKPPVIGSPDDQVPIVLEADSHLL